jgi:hypothetical protein
MREIGREDSFLPELSDLPVKSARSRPVELADHHLAGEAMERPGT